MDKSLLVKIFGFPATLIHGDPLVLDRWLWLRKRLPKTVNGEKLLDIGCGTGAFSIGAALRGYQSLGLSWDARNQQVANERAKLCQAHSALFEVQDVRNLGSRTDLFNQFEVAICCENIEHIIDDQKLIVDIAKCLMPGGRLLLTTPFYYYRAITPGDNGPFSKVEDGGHVRRGYTEAMLQELCESAGLILEKTTFCSGFTSQKLCFFLRYFGRLHPIFAWGLTLPFRLLPPIIDKVVSGLLQWPYFSICIEVYKPRSQKSYPDLGF
ncbi:MAG: methyltransferase domain-containing protein [SAR324 cluster bacterium]|nr:methyltransferase domain-containing protein [SAR324 cluster bacterium]